MSRYAFGIQTPSDPSMVFSFEKIHLANIQALSLNNCGHELPKSVYLTCPQILCTGGSLTTILESRNTASELLLQETCDSSKIRIIATHSKFSIDSEIPFFDDLLILVERLTNCEQRGWYPSGKKSIHALIKIDCDIDDIYSLLEDITLDISLANSRPYINIISKIIADIGRDNFYKTKVDFALSLQHSNTAYGTIDENCDYVSLSAIARDMSHRMPTSKRIALAISLWDDFLIRKYSNYLFDARQAADVLKLWPLIGGQLPLAKSLEEEIKFLKPGPWVMLFVKRSRHVMKEISSQIGGSLRGDTLNGFYKFIRPSNINIPIEKLLREGHLSSLKFLLREN